MERTRPDASRLRAALTLAVTGAVSLFAVLLIHELLVFGGPAMGLIQPASAVCATPPCLTVDMIVWGHVAKAIGAGVVFALVGAVWTGGRKRWAIAGGFWALQYLWSLVGIASGYRAHFGTGWTWWEPFAQLLFHPLTTPGLMLAGLSVFISLDLAARRRSPRPAGGSV